MKFVYTLLFLLISSSAIAQESIGFTDSTDFEYLIDYRLPDWGYGLFSLNSFSTGFNGSKSDRDLTRNNFLDLPEQNKIERKNFNAGFNIMPQYELFRENEERTYLIQTNVIVGSSFGKNEQGELQDQNGVIVTSDQFSNNRQFRFDHDFTSTGSFYLNDNVFFNPSLTYRMSYRTSFSEAQNDDITTNEVQQFSRNLRIVPGIGIGFGRIRNITPILRSLRLNERYKALGNAPLNSQEITNASEQFTRYNAYPRNWDRPLKYFWEDMNSGLNGKLDELSSFDAFFLNDIFNENLGSRFEGYSISISINYDLRSNLNRNDNQVSDILVRNSDIDRDVIAGVSGIWYKNLNLNHQLSVRSNWNLRLPVSKENPERWRLDSFNEFSWLWILADRFLLENSIFSSYRSLDRKNLDTFQFYDIDTSLRSDLTFFVENKFSVSGGIYLRQNYRFSKSQIQTGSTYQRYDSSSWNWGVTVSLRYYFNRNLF